MATAVQGRRAMRDARVIAAMLAGQTQDMVAEREGISPRRVRQIIEEHPGVRAEMRRRRAAERAAIRRRVMRWSKAHPQGRVEDAAVALGLDPKQVRAGLGDRLALHTGSVRVWSDEQVAAAVATFLSDPQGTPSTARYRVIARQKGWPSLSTVLARYGTWRAAMRAARAIPHHE